MIDVTNRKSSSMENGRQDILCYFGEDQAEGEQRSEWQQKGESNSTKWELI